MGLQDNYENNIINNLIGDDSLSNTVSKKSTKTKRSRLRSFITGALAVAGTFSLFGTANAQQITDTYNDKWYNVSNVPAENLKFKLSPLEFKNVDDAKQNLDDIIKWLGTRKNKDILLSDGIDDYLVEVDNTKHPIAYQRIGFQSFTNALSGLRNIPNKANSWDRLEIAGFENINGVDYVKLFQNPKDKTSWLSTRWNQIFNYLKLMPGIAEDEAKIREIIKFNVKKEYGIDLDASKMEIISRIDQNNNQLSICDIIYHRSGEYDEKIPRHVVAKQDARNYEFKKGHILIQQEQEGDKEKKEIWLPMSVIPKDIVQLQDFLSRDAKDDYKLSEPGLEGNNSESENDDAESETPPDTKLSLATIIGYELDTWREKGTLIEDRVTDTNMDSEGLLVQTWVDLSNVNGWLAQIKGSYYVPNNSSYIDNNTGINAGLFTNHEFDLEAVTGKEIGNEDFMLFLGLNYVFEKKHPTIKYDVVNVESKIRRNIIGLEIRAGLKTEPVSVKIFGTYGLGDGKQTDLGINDNDAEVSNPDIENIAGGATLSLGPVDVSAKYNVRNYFADGGFTQNGKEKILDIEGIYNISDDWVAKIEYKNYKNTIQDRDFVGKLSKIRIGAGYRFNFRW